MPSKTHGMSRTKLYKRWAEMKRRCTNIKSHAYKDYGGRGIELCEEWFAFEPFMKWSFENGYSDNLDLDRKNNELGYSPDNCRYATKELNANNKRTSKIIEIDGVSKNLCTWAKEYGICHKTISHRLKVGITGKELLCKPYTVTRLPHKSTIRKNTVFLEINGVKKQISEWSKDSGVPYHTIKGRIRRGVTGVEIIKKYVPKKEITFPSNPKIRITKENRNDNHQSRSSKTSRSI